ncbi:MAG: sulfate respiration complex protein HmcE [Pseudomonadota bacterium]
MYDFLTGPMLWLALAVFVAGMFARVVWYLKGLNWQLDRVAYRAHPRAGLTGAARSILYWMVPFGSHGWRVQPFMTVVSFLFHLGAVLVPLFLLAHRLILVKIFGFWLPAMPQVFADVFTWAVLVSLALLALRRVALPEVRILTTAHDGFILALSALPFVTGLLARYQVGDHYAFWMVAHIICGEAFLILAPFTKLSHIVLFFMSRGQLGSDFGIKRGGLNGKKMAW